MTPFKKLTNRILRAWSALETLDDRVYYMILTVGIVVCMVTSVANVIQRLDILSTVTTIILGLYLVILQVVSIRRRNDPKVQQICRLLLVLGVNFILFPVIFFASGGIYSGMVIFYLISFFLDAILLRGNLGGFVFILSLLALEFSITLAQRFPAAVTDMTPEQHYQDVKVTLFLAGMALYAMTVLILRAYEIERKHNEELMKRLTDLLVKDTLSDLFNRRELFRRLDVMYQGTRQERSETLTRDNCYIAMFDVDNFKKLNDTYGHSFGDKALSEVARVLRDAVRPCRGELAARYGGKEFICVLYSPNQQEAFGRVDAARQRISELQWEDIPGLAVTVSGGIISCEEYPELGRAMHDVDKLLYQAKAAGKNQICDRLEDSE